LVAIRGFRHKGLELLFTAGKVSKVQAEHAERLRLILGRLNVAREPRDMGLPRRKSILEASARSSPPLEHGPLDSSGCCSCKAGNAGPR
jgi:hypothetical protein